METRHISSITLYANVRKPGPVETAAKLAPWIRARGLECRVPADLASLLPGEMPSPEDDVLNADLVVVLGGDGTTLTVARKLARRRGVMLTVRFGSFGFLAEVEPEEVEIALEQVLAGDCNLEVRPMLSTTRLCGGKVVEEHPALNDVALVRGGSSRLVKIEAFLNDSPLAVYSGDGVLVSTATGSTGYNLAAGGPIVHPTLDAYIITPICPHALHFRSLVVPGESRLVLRMAETDGEAQTSVDGQITFPLRHGDELQVRQSPFGARFITLPGRPTIYDKVRLRLRWGERLL